MEDKTYFSASVAGVTYGKDGDVIDRSKSAVNRYSTLTGGNLITYSAQMNPVADS